MCPKNETDPLLVLPNKTASTVRKNKRRKQKRNCIVLTITLLSLAMLSGILLVVKTASQHPTSLLGMAKAARLTVEFDAPTGIYSVNHREGSITPETTFAELAEEMIHPWYEASIMALLDDPAWDSEGGILPENIRPIRKVLLITRDMLDIFSPVFPDTEAIKPPKKKNKPRKKKKHKSSGKDRSLWKKLRTEFRKGYQLAGELHDLYGITYSRELLNTRVKALLDWKKGFVSFQKKHRIRRYLYTGGIDPHGCYYHEASHLFWADSADSFLPCGDDSGTASLRRLGSVQLEHCLSYLNIIQNYDTVMPRDHEINFHNLRKELRIFVDEYGIFGNLLVPDDDDDDGNNDENDESLLFAASNETSGSATTIEEKIDLLDETQSRLGHVNDLWTAHDIYVSEDSHHTKQEKLAVKTDGLWKKFLVWESENDLRETLEAVVSRMNA
jgi:hypothetical protein